MGREVSGMNKTITFHAPSEADVLEVVLTYRDGRLHQMEVSAPACTTPPGAVPGAAYRATVRRDDMSGDCVHGGEALLETAARALRVEAGFPPETEQ